MSALYEVDLSRDHTETGCKLACSPCDIGIYAKSEITRIEVVQALSA